MYCTTHYFFLMTFNLMIHSINHEISTYIIIVNNDFILKRDIDFKDTIYKSKVVKTRWFNLKSFYEKMLCQIFFQSYNTPGWVGLKIIKNLIPWYTLYLKVPCTRFEVEYMF